MTARAARMLAALEDGCQTREQIFAHQGRFSLLNNGAAELRAAGIDVVCEIVDGDYVYRLSDGCLPNASPGEPRAPITEPVHADEDGQLVLVAA